MKDTQYIKTDFFLDLDLSVSFLLTPVPAHLSHRIPPHVPPSSPPAEGRGFLSQIA